MPNLSKDHRFVKNPNTTGAILYKLTKGGHTVKISTIEKELKKAGRKITNLRNRIYWFGRWVEKLGFDAEITTSGNTGKLDTIKLIKREKAKKAAKPVKASKKAKSSKSKKESAVAVESESDESSESESADESQE
jgi:hypothetical protein